MNSEHDIGKVTREYVPPKCNRGEFGHHAQRQAFICHSYRIHTPTRLQDTRKPAARVSLNRPLPITPNRTSLPAQKCAVPARTSFGDEVSDTFSLGVPHPLAAGTHRPRTRLVQMVVGPTRCAAVKAYVPARWGVGSRRLRRLFCEVLFLPLPQLVRGRRATCRSACMLLSRARTRVSRPGLMQVRPRWVYR